MFRVAILASPFGSAALGRCLPLVVCVGENTLNSGNAGVWKTVDSGASWTNTSSSAAQSLSWSAVVIDPNNSQIVYAAAGVFFGGFSNGVYKSSDGGNNWRFLSNFPTGAGRISLAVSKSNSQVLYAAAATPSGSNFGVLYKMVRSDDGAIPLPT